MAIKRWFPGGAYRQMADFNRRRGQAGRRLGGPPPEVFQRSGPRPGQPNLPPSSDLLDPSESSTRDILARSSTGFADRRAANILSEFEWQEMASSRMSRAGYSDELREIRVVWVNRPNEVWAYFNVERQTWEMLATSDSPGRFVNQVLNSYAYSRIQ